MQVGRVIFILTEEESNHLLSILDTVSIDKGTNRDTVSELRESLKNAKKTVFIDDLRTEKVDMLS